MSALTTSPFEVVFGRELLGALPGVASRPYLVVTMKDLWPKFERSLAGFIADVYYVTSLDVDKLTADVGRLPACGSIIGLGGGQAIDVAKFFSWIRSVPLFQVPTATTSNAPFAHRAALRMGDRPLTIGWAVPDAVLVDYDVIQAAPPYLNQSGVSDILCLRTAHYDWRLAHEARREDRRWPYDDRLVTEAGKQLESVMANLDDIRAVSDEGIRTLTLAHRWTGAAYCSSGWNEDLVVGTDHQFLYCLEAVTGKHFLHGQAVGLGILIGAELQQDEPDVVAATLRRSGIDIRPEAMGITWEDATTAMRRLAGYARDAGLSYTIAQSEPMTDHVVERIRSRLYPGDA